MVSTNSQGCYFSEVLMKHVKNENCLIIPEAENFESADMGSTYCCFWTTKNQGFYQSLLLAKAFPEWDFRYFSKATAVDLFLKAR